MTDENQDTSIDETIAAEEPPQYGVGPFSIREVALVGTWLVAFVVSFFPVSGAIGEGPSVWSSGIDWVLTIGVPTVAVFLIVLRRLSPQGIRRVGSLGIDQFASVAFSVATVLWLTIIWNSFITLAEHEIFPATWVVWVEVILMLAGVVLTVFAPFIPPFAQDFQGRPESIAHRNARQVRPVAPRPLITRPDPTPRAEPSAGEPADVAATSTPYGADSSTPARTDDEVASDDFATTVIPVEREDADTTPAGGAPSTTEPSAVEPEPARESFEHVENPSSTVEPASTTSSQHQAFWALVPEERDVVDEIGIPVFRIGPTAWALVIEDRGDVFVVRHEDGRIGYLHDTSGVTRG